VLWLGVGWVDDLGCLWLVNLEEVSVWLTPGVGVFLVENF